MASSRQNIAAAKNPSHTQPLQPRPQQVVGSSGGGLKGTTLLCCQVLREGKQGLCAWRILQWHFEQHIDRHARILSAAALHVEVKTAHEGVALCVVQPFKLKVHVQTRQRNQSNAAQGADRPVNHQSSERLSIVRNRYMRGTALTVPSMFTYSRR